MTTLAHATLVEHQIMEHIKAALRLTLDAKSWPAAQGHKLAGVRFMTDSFGRHFQRLIDLEEEGGYLLAECEREPALSVQITALREEHAELRRQLDQALQALHSLADDEDDERFDGLCRALQHLLSQIDSHDAREVELLQQVLLTGHVGTKLTGAT
jgi:hypothetical protein